MDKVTQYNKGIVAAIMGALMMLEAWIGLDISGVDEQWIITLLGLLTPILVVITPNRT